MPMFVWAPFKEANLKLDERTYLNGSNTNLKVLVAHECPATSMAMRAFHVAGLSTLVFGLVVFSYIIEFWTESWSWVLYVAGMLLWIWRILCVLVLLASAVYAQYFKRCYQRALIFWAWLPCVHLVHCTGAFIGGTELGHYVWTTYLGPYSELSHLKVVKGLDPAITPGTAVMDAGLVEFADTFSVDRARGGCYKNYGHTYCVAPIVNNGAMSPTGTGNSPRYGTYDYFAVGVDCCTCPNTDFRCGEWFNPDAQGGIRSLDIEARARFHLAVDDFRASWGKDIGHTLFFNWVQDSVSVYNSYWERSIYVSALSVLLWLLCTFFGALMIAQIFQALIRNNIASPLDTPPPPPGVEKIWIWFLPSMLYYAEEERRQYLGLPESEAPFYPLPPDLHGHRESHHENEDLAHLHAAALGPPYAPRLAASIGHPEHDPEHPSRSPGRGFVPAPGTNHPHAHTTFNYSGYGTGHY